MVGSFNRLDRALAISPSFSYLPKAGKIAKVKEGILKRLKAQALLGEIPPGKLMAGT